MGGGKGAPATPEATPEDKFNYANPASAIQTTFLKDEEGNDIIDETAGTRREMTAADYAKYGAKPLPTKGAGLVTEAPQSGIQL